MIDLDNTVDDYAFALGYRFAPTDLTIEFLTLEEGCLDTYLGKFERLMETIDSFCSIEYDEPLDSPTLVGYIVLMSTGESRYKVLGQFNKPSWISTLDIYEAIRVYQIPEVSGLSELPALDQQTLRLDSGIEPNMIIEHLRSPIAIVGVFGSQLVRYA